MRCILEDLYYGELRPCENSVVRSMSLVQMIEIMEREEQKLCQTLEGKQRTSFLRYVNESQQVEATTSMQSFLDGFCLGARLMMEIFSR